jgi:hypothetical protein
VSTAAADRRTAENSRQAAARAASETASAVGFFRVPEMPQPLMRRHQALDTFAAVGVGRNRPAGQHIFKNMKQLLGNFIISLVAGVME